MEVPEILTKELNNFLRSGKLKAFLEKDDWSWLPTFEGVLAIGAVCLTAVYAGELLVSLWRGTFRRRDFVPQFLAYCLNRTINVLVFLGSTLFWYGVFEPYQLFKLPLAWYTVAYGVVMYDLGVWLCHWASHKVRFLWCFHDPHHTSETMNIGVASGNFFLESVFLNFFRILVAVFFGLTPQILLFVFILDAAWVRFAHISEAMLPNGRLGILNTLLITPSLHRVHHGRNLRYLDMNYANVITLWDWLFGTYKREDPDEKVQYGLTTPTDVDNFKNYYLGEYIKLWKDVRQAPTWRDKLNYLIMPPGWSHTGDHKMTHVVRQQTPIAEPLTAS
jgi:sterol desaturase/sphingolipid hydroxylase (fatty acid hydroxylase superfamily)